MKPIPARLRLPALATLTLLLSTSAAAVLPARSAADPPAGGRVVILGFDGADARTIRELMSADPDAFPAFRKLAAEGTFEPLEVVAPPESPVSWAALNTGQNPAKTGVPGFIKRVISGSFVRPDFGHIEQHAKTTYGDNRVSLEDLGPVELPRAGWSSLALLAGGGVFLVVLLLGMFAFRGGLKAIGFVLALLLGGVAAWGGQALSGRSTDELIPQRYPVTKNPNKARNLWDYAADAGVQSVVLDAAQAFDMPPPPGARMLAGLGVPDALGGLGDWAVYTTDPDEFDRNGRDTTTAGHVYRVDDYDGRIQASIRGPVNFCLQDDLDRIDAELKSPATSLKKSNELSQRYLEVKGKLDEGPVTLPMDITLERDQGRARVTIAGQEQVVPLGEWSDFYELGFELNPVITVHAITRVRLIKLDPYFELFLNVLDIDPRQPPYWQPISYPHGFAAELAADCGLYETYGWPTATMPVKDGEVDPELLMEDVEFTMKWRERLTHAALARNDWRLLMSVFNTTDRVQHMMYRYYDEGHPEFVADEANREMTFFGETIRLRDAVPAIYRQMDRIVGDVMASLRPDDTLMVCSDHGFQSFRRQVNVNNWLAENGYLAVAPGKPTRFLQFIDWDKTRVYSLGMGFLFLNLEGREPKGIVKLAEADALMQEVKEKLLAATDPDTGARFCKDVYVTKDVHQGPYLDQESDMLIGFAPPYRVGWSSTSGGLSMVKGEDGVMAPVCTDNDSPWSGGHVSVALPDVAGVFFSNKKVRKPSQGVRSLQVAPTALALLGVPKPPEMDLDPLQFE